MPTVVTPAVKVTALNAESERDGAETSDLRTGEASILVIVALLQADAAVRVAARTIIDAESERNKSRT